MMSNWKAYLKYYIKSNRRLLILVFVMLFLLMPFVTFNTRLDVSDSSPLNVYTMLGMMTCVCGCILSYLIPIFNYRFLYKKSSHELYYALPITRKKLFQYTFVSGLAAMYAPLLANYAIGRLGILFLRYEYMSISGSVVFMLGLCLLLLIQYSIFTLLSVKCNNLIDSILVNAAYVIMPMVVLIATFTFFDRQIAVIIGNVGASSHEFLDLGLLQQLLSLPMMISDYFVHCIISFAEETKAFQMFIGNYSWWLILYWGILGGGCLWLAQQAFIERKPEDAQQRTTTLFGYPLIIVVTSFSLILFVMNMNGTILLPSIIILAFYFCMIFFSNRSIRIRPLHVLVFVCIYCSTFAFSYLFTQSSGFGIVKEYPVLDAIQSAQVQISIKEPVPYPIYKEENQKEELSEISIYGVGEDAVQKAVQIQEACVQQNTEITSYDEAYFITFTYYRKEDGQSIYREYYMKMNAENQKYIQGLLKQKDGVTISYSTIDR